MLKERGSKDSWFRFWLEVFFKQLREKAAPTILG